MVQSTVFRADFHAGRRVEGLGDDGWGEGWLVADMSGRCRIGRSSAPKVTAAAAASSDSVDHSQTMKGRQDKWKENEGSDGHLRRDPGPGPGPTPGAAVLQPPYSLQPTAYSLPTLQLTAYSPL